MTLQGKIGTLGPYPQRLRNTSEGAYESDLFTSTIPIDFTPLDVKSLPVQPSYHTTGSA